MVALVLQVLFVAPSAWFCLFPWAPWVVVIDVSIGLSCSDDSVVDSTWLGVFVVSLAGL